MSAFDKFIDRLAFYKVASVNTLLYLFVIYTLHFFQQLIYWVLVFRYTLRPIGVDYDHLLLAAIIDPLFLLFIDFIFFIILVRFARDTSNIYKEKMERKKILSEPIPQGSVITPMEFHEISVTGVEIMDEDKNINITEQEQEPDTLDSDKHGHD